MIYICYRPLSLAMFWLTNISEETDWIMSLRHAVPSNMPSWIIYALPDGLWSCSYTILVGTIWDFDLSKCVYMLLFIPALGFISELLQGGGIVPGVFDWSDLIAYLLGVLLGFMYVYFMMKKQFKAI